MHKSSRVHQISFIYVPVFHAHIFLQAISRNQPLLHFPAAVSPSHFQQCKAQKQSPIKMHRAATKVGLARSIKRMASPPVKCVFVQPLSSPNMPSHLNCTEALFFPSSEIPHQCFGILCINHTSDHFGRLFSHLHFNALWTQLVGVLCKCTPKRPAVHSSTMHSRSTAHSRKSYLRFWLLHA